MSLFEAFLEAQQQNAKDKQFLSEAFDKEGNYIL